MSVSATIEAVDEVQIEWDRTFDWSDDDMSQSLKQRLRESDRSCWRWPTRARAGRLCPSTESNAATCHP